MESLKFIIYWAGYVYYVYVFGYASLFKVFQKPAMMQGMEAFGFNKIPTILIGVCELSGALLMLIGLFKAVYRNIAILFLFPFAIGAFTTHLAHREYNDFYNALAVCVLSVIMLWADKTFKITL